RRWTRPAARPTRSSPGGLAKRRSTRLTEGVILTVALALAFQPGPPLAAHVCESDPATGALNVHSIIQAPRQPYAGPEAADLDWYRADESIAHDGRRYEPSGGAWSPGELANRDLELLGLHRGAPLFRVLIGEAGRLAVLVRQQGCVFRTYAPAEHPGD